MKIIRKSSIDRYSRIECNCKTQIIITDNELCKCHNCNILIFYRENKFILASAITFSIEEFNTIKNMNIKIKDISKETKFISIHLPNIMKECFLYVQQWFLTEPEIKDNPWNSTCHKCNSPAWITDYSWECSKGCSRY